MNALPRILPFSGPENSPAPETELDTAAWLHRFIPSAFSLFDGFEALDPWAGDAHSARVRGGKLGIGQAPWRRFGLDMTAVPLLTTTALWLVLAEQRPMLHLAMLAALQTEWLVHTTVEFREAAVVVLWDQARLSKKHLSKGSALGVRFELPDLRAGLESHFKGDFGSFVLLPASASGLSGCLQQSQDYFDNFDKTPHFVLETRSTP